MPPKTSIRLRGKTFVPPIGQLVDPTGELAENALNNSAMRNSRIEFR